MRVGYVLKRYPRYSETFIVNEILAHEAAGLEIAIFALRPPSDAHFQDAISRVRAPVTYIPNRPVSSSVLWQELCEFRDTHRTTFDCDGLLGEDAYTVRQVLLLAKEVQSQAIDHLHAHFGTVSTATARLVGKLTGIPYSFTAHAKDIFHESVRKDDLGRKIRDASAVVTVSDFNVRHLLDEYPEAKTKIARVYNGLDLNCFSYESPDQRAPLILGIGRLVEKKGFFDLVEACAQLKRLGCDFKCHIIGEGEVESDLRARIDELGLESIVELVGGRPQNEVIAEIHQAAVLACPCVIAEDGNRDGLPTVLLEAMALGTPCVSTSVTGIPEAIRDGETGLIVPQHNPQELARALMHLLSDARERVRLSKRARGLIESEFDIHINAQQLRAIFENAGRDRAKTAHPHL